MTMAGDLVSCCPSIGVGVCLVGGVGECIVGGTAVGSHDESNAIIEE